MPNNNSSFKNTFKNFRLGGIPEVLNKVPSGVRDVATSIKDTASDIYKNRQQIAQSAADKFKRNAQSAGRVFNKIKTNPVIQRIGNGLRKAVRQAVNTSAERGREAAQNLQRDVVDKGIKIVNQGITKGTQLYNKGQHLYKQYGSKTPQQIAHELSSLGYAQANKRINQISNGLATSAQQAKRLKNMLSLEVYKRRQNRNSTVEQFRSAPGEAAPSKFKAALDGFSQGLQDGVNGVNRVTSRFLNNTAIGADGILSAATNIAGIPVRYAAKGIRKLRGGTTPGYLENVLAPRDYHLISPLTGRFKDAMHAKPYHDQKFMDSSTMRFFNGAQSAAMHLIPLATTLPRTAAVPAYRSLSLMARKVPLFGHKLSRAVRSSDTLKNMSNLNVNLQPVLNPVANTLNKIPKIGPKLAQGLKSRAQFQVPLGLRAKRSLIAEKLHVPGYSIFSPFKVPVKHIKALEGLNSKIPWYVKSGGTLANLYDVTKPIHGLDYIPEGASDAQKNRIKRLNTVMDYARFANPVTFALNKTTQALGVQDRAVAYPVARMLTDKDNALNDVIPTIFNVGKPALKGLRWAANKSNILTDQDIEKGKEKVKEVGDIIATTDTNRIPQQILKKVPQIAPYIRDKAVALLPPRADTQGYKRTLDLLEDRTTDLASKYIQGDINTKEDFIKELPRITNVLQPSWPLRFAGLQGKQRLDSTGKPMPNAFRRALMRQPYIQDLISTRTKVEDKARPLTDFINKRKQDVSTYNKTKQRVTTYADRAAQVQAVLYLLKKYGLDMQQATQLVKTKQIPKIPK